MTILQFCDKIKKEGIITPSRRHANHPLSSKYTDKELNHVYL